VLSLHSSNDPGELSYSYSFISTKVDKKQLYNRPKIKCDGDRTEKKVNVIYTGWATVNNQILELGQLLTSSTCKISLPMTVVMMIAP